MPFAVLGICNAETSSACLMMDGELVSAVSEERFTRTKMDSSFPRLSIASVLEQGGFTHPAQVDAIAYSWSKGIEPGTMRALLERLLTEERDHPSGVPILLERIEVEMARDSARRQEFDSWVIENGVADKVVDYYHHEGHALSAALLSPFDRALIVTADARGDYESGAVWMFQRSDEKPLTKLVSIPSNDSLGFFYGRITGLLGFRPTRHEGKITGLAALGNPVPARELMKSMIRFENGTIRAVNGPFFRPFFSHYEPELIAAIESHPREDIAAAAQRHLEELVASLVRGFVSPDDPIDVALAGGVFANVRVNQVVRELPGVARIFVQPQMGDGGLCLGAASGATHERGIHVKPMRTARLGPESPPVSIDAPDLRTFTGSREELSEATVRALEEGKVVGVVRGRMEFGPRALCARTILYRTSDVTVNDWLNLRLDRTEFMPFAPVTTRELAPRAFVGIDVDDPTLPFMTATFDCTEEFLSVSPAVCHVDRTARPQVIAFEDDPFLHDMISRWHERTGELALINTSFNMHEEPIIFTSDRGLEALRAGVIDALLLDESLVLRREGSDES